MLALVFNLSCRQHDVRSLTAKPVKSQGRVCGWAAMRVRDDCFFSFIGHWSCHRFCPWYCFFAKTMSAVSYDLTDHVLGGYMTVGIELATWTDCPHIDIRTGVIIAQYQDPIRQQHDCKMPTPGLMYSVLCQIQSRIKKILARYWHWVWCHRHIALCQVLIKFDSFNKIDKIVTSGLEYM